MCLTAATRMTLQNINYTNLSSYQFETNGQIHWKQHKGTHNMLLVSPSTIFHSHFVYHHPFSSYRPVWDKCSNELQNDLPISRSITQSYYPIHVLLISANPLYFTLSLYVQPWLTGHSILLPLGLMSTFARCGNGQISNFHKNLNSNKSKSVITIEEKVQGAFKTIRKLFVYRSSFSKYYFRQVPWC